MKVGITGSNGFIGWHLQQFLSLKSVEVVPFKRDYFSHQEDFESFAKECNVIIHLAAINRHTDQDVLYNTNIALVEKLVQACTNKKPAIYFASSIHEKADNPFGRSKEKGWKILEDWGRVNEILVGSFVIPNVFGPFGNPEYNSFVATFCHKVARGEEPEVNGDATIGLVHVHDLVKSIWSSVEKGLAGKVLIEPDYHVSVKTVLEKLNSYKATYLEKGEFPSLESKFDKQLFNMFRTYIPHDHYPFSLKQHKDNRGFFSEVVRANTSGQFSYSMTVPGITRGNHFHTRKAERFTVISGKASIKLRKIGTEEVVKYSLDGENPSYVDMPIWYTHNITNIGNEELITLFWINEPYDSEDPDTFFLDV